MRNTMPAGDTFEPAIWDEIIARIRLGEPLRQICRDEKMPSYGTVYDKLEQDEDYASLFARARSIGFDAIAEECFEIAEDGTNDWVTRERKDGSEYEDLNHEHVQRSKLRIETRLKLLAKWDPKRYGDRITNEHTGGIKVIQALPEDESI